MTSGPSAAPTQEADALGRRADRSPAGGSGATDDDRASRARRRRSGAPLRSGPARRPGGARARAGADRARRASRRRRATGWASATAAARSKGSHFQRIVQPGSGLFFNGLFDQLYLYPADQQNYIISKTAEPGLGEGGRLDHRADERPGAGRVPGRRRTSSSNTDRLRAFHEQLGLQVQRLHVRRVEERCSRTRSGSRSRTRSSRRPALHRRRADRQRRGARRRSRPRSSATIAEPTRRVARPGVLLRTELPCRAASAGRSRSSSSRSTSRRPSAGLRGDRRPAPTRRRRSRIVSKALREAGPEYTKLVAVESGNDDVLDPPGRHRRGRADARVDRAQHA